MSGKREQALRIEPKTEIHFKGPYNRVVTEYFHLSNPTEKPIAFKVKTTAPKRYCVRPNNGIIASGKTVTVAVMLQPQGDGANASAALFEKNKHKFMIQSVFASSDTGNADDMFKSVPSEDVMDSKFRCVFDDTANLVPGPPGVAGKQAAAYAGESDGDSGNDKDLTEAFSGAQRTNAGDHDSEPSAPAYSTVSNLATRDSAHLSNGSEDEHGIGSSSVSTTSHSRLPTYSSVIEGGETVKRLQEENRDLRLKLSELERASRSGGSGGAYNRFATSSQSSTQKAGTAGSQQSATNLIEPALSTQVILMVLVSLVIGFIIGKVDFGFF